MVTLSSYCPIVKMQLLGTAQRPQWNHNHCPGLGVFHGAKPQVHGGSKTTV